MHTQESNIQNSKISEAVAILESIDREDIENLEESVQAKILNQYNVIKNTIAESSLTAKKNIKAQAKQVDESAHSNPWTFIGAATLLGAATGFVLGSRRK